MAGLPRPARLQGAATPDWGAGAGAPKRLSSASPWAAGSKHAGQTSLPAAAYDSAEQSAPQASQDTATVPPPSA